MAGLENKADKASIQKYNNKGYFTIRFLRAGKLRLYCHRYNNKLAGRVKTGK